MIAKYGKALEYDLMTRTGYTLADVPEKIPWASLRSFVSGLDMDSALARSIRPELEGWATRAKTNAILADIADILAMINANLVALGNHKRAKTPDPYPRPGQGRNNHRRHIGKGAMPPEELKAWIAERRRRKWQA